MHLLHSLCLTLLVIKVTVEKNQTHAFTAGKYTFIINYTPTRGAKLAMSDMLI